MNDLKAPEVGREIATTADGMDITRGYVGPLLTPYDSVLRNRGNGDLVIYEQVFSDPEVKSAFQQRQLAVTKCEWQVDAGGDRPIDEEAAEFMRGQLHRIGWDNVTNKMQYGVFYGYAVAEAVYAREGRLVVIDRIKVRNRRRFRYDKDGELRLLTMHQMHEGIPAEAPYFWHFATGADNDDEPYGLGLAHWLYWLVLFKRNGLKFWLIFLEKFGMPTAVGKYDEDAKPEERSALLAAARALQVDSGIIMPKGMELTLLEAARSGTADYEKLQSFLNAAIDKVVLGQTASTSGTPGKLGNEELQSDVRDDIVKADADLICESWNLFARQLIEWNFPGAVPPRVYRVTEEAEDLDAAADRDKTISEMGFKPSLGYIIEKYGGEWTEKAPPPELDPDADPAAAGNVPAVPGAQFAEGTVDADPAELMAQQLDASINPQIAKWVDQVRELAANAESLEQLREGVLALAPEMSLQQYSDAMAEAMTAAQLAGRYEVQQEVAGQPGGRTE